SAPQTRTNQRRRRQRYEPCSAGRARGDRGVGRAGGDDGGSKRSFRLGGGLIAPLSTYKDDDKAGWLAGANVEFAIPLSPVGVRVDGLYGETKHKDIGGSPVDGKTRLIGGLASVVWNIPVPAPIVKPYVLAGGGLYNVKI